MTGSIKKSFSSPASPLPAMVLIAGEMTWLSLCFGALADTSPSFSMDVPYLAMLLPAVLAVLLARLLRQLRGPLWARIPVLVALELATLAFGAGLLASRSVPGSFASVALHPWTVTGRIPSATSAIAWFAVSLAVARGTWLGLLRHSFRQVGRSAAVAGIFFLTLFVVLGTNANAGLARATRGAPVLFVVFFLEILVLAHLMRLRDASTEGVLGPPETKGKVWGPILIVPVVVVLGLALLVMLALGAYGGTIGHGARDAGVGVGVALLAVVHAFDYLLVHLFEAVAAAIGAIVGLFDHHAIGKSKPFHSTTPSTIAKTLPPPRVPVAGGVAVALLLVGGVGILFWRHRPRRDRPERIAPQAEELYSVFTWKHLFSLFFSWLSRSLSGLWHRVFAPRLAPAHDVESSLVGVRAQYLRVLLAARGAGYERGRSETAREFAARLGAGLGERAPVLATLTGRYEMARYAGSPEDEPQGSFATEEAEVLVQALAVLASQPEVAAAEGGAPRPDTAAVARGFS